MGAPRLPCITLLLVVVVGAACAAGGTLAAPVQSLGSAGASPSTVPTAGFFSAMVFDPENGTIFVVNWDDSNVTVIDGNTGALLTRVPVGLHPDSLAFDPRSDDVYVTNSGSNNVSVVSGATDSVVKTVAVGTEPCAVLVDGENADAYVANFGSSNVTVVDPTNWITTSIPVPGSADALAENSTTGNVYVGNYYSEDYVAVISGTANAVASTIPTPGTTPWSLAADPFDGQVFAPLNGSGSNAVAVIDQETNSVVTKVPVGLSPRAIAVDAANDGVYVANIYSGNVSVISGATDSVIASIPVGLLPWAIAVDNSTNTIFVANQGSNNVTVINGTTDTVVQSIPTGTEPSAVAIDPSAGRVYVSNFGSTTITGISTTPSPAAPPPSSSPSPGFLDLSGNTGYFVLAGVVITAVALVAVAVLFRRFRKKETAR